MATPSSPTANAFHLGVILRELRISAGLTVEGVGAALKWSGSKMSRIELARFGVRPGDVELLLDHYGVTGARREEIMAVAQGVSERPWYMRYTGDLLPGYKDLLGLEQGASWICAWEPDAIPVLLRTAGYAHATVSTYAQVASLPPAKAERLVQIQLHRQGILVHDLPPQVTVVMDEAVLNRPVGESPRVMREQLHHIAEAMSGPRVIVRILPHGSPARLFSGPFAIYRFEYDGAQAGPPDAIGMEHLRCAVVMREEADAFFYWTAFQALLKAALGPEESKALILEVAEAY